MNTELDECELKFKDLITTPFFWGLLTAIIGLIGLGVLIGKFLF